MQASVDPVDEEIGKADEEGDLDEAVVREGLFGGCVVKFGVSADLQNEERSCQQWHWGHCSHGLSDLQPNLVLEELGVIVSCLVPDKDVWKRGDQEVDEQTKQPNWVLVLVLTRGEKEEWRDWRITK